MTSNRATQANPMWPAKLATALMVSMLCGCAPQDVEQYLGHSDKVSSGAGNAKAVNRVTHTVDPWPIEARNSKIDMDGKRAAIAAGRYETNTSLKPKGLSAQETTIEVKDNGAKIQN